MTIHFSHDYKFTHVNWLQFTFVHADYERDHMTGTSHIELALLGLHVTLSWVHDQKTLDEFNAEMDEAKQECIKDINNVHL